jgi:hypothetical protein
MSKYNHPIEELELHCAYRTGKRLCKECRERLIKEAVIVHDFYLWGEKKIKRQIYFIDDDLTIRMKNSPGPSSLIGEDAWDILPKHKLSLYINRPADRLDQIDTFTEKIEELYTYQMFLLEAGDRQKLRDRKKLPLY